MRVTFNTTYRQGIADIAQNATELAARQREVSSGKRLHVPSDDPTAVASAITERTEMAVTDHYQQAADNASSRLSVVDTALSELITQTTSAKVAAMSVLGSDASASQREAAASQLEGIRDSMLSTVNTQFRGTYLFSGNDGTTQPYTLQGSTVSSYQGGSGTIDVDVDRQTAVRVGVAGDTMMKGQDADDVFAVLDKLAAAARSGDSTALQSGTDALDRAFSRLSTAQSRVGTDLADIDTSRTQLETRKLGSQSRLSTLEDTDMAASISAMTQADTAYKAALGAVSATEKLSLLDYLK